MLQELLTLLRYSISGILSKSWRFIESVIFARDTDVSGSESPSGGSSVDLVRLAEVRFSSERARKRRNSEEALACSFLGTTADCADGL